MPHKAKYYEYAIFPPEVIREAYARFVERLPEERKATWIEHYSIGTGLEHKDYDTQDEFFAEYRKGFVEADLSMNHRGSSFKLKAQPYQSYIVGIPTPGTQIDVNHTSAASIEYVFEIFERNREKYTLPLRPRIFIGHGRSSQWRDLKDHLQDLHGYEVIAYEVGARAGMSIKEVLEAMLTISSFALLVLTGEDLDAEGRFHARENVIHELGLFQGRLGFRRAIVLLEEGVQEFSNIHGLNQLRFSKGNIKETFGDILATIRREFG